MKRVLADFDSATPEYKNQQRVSVFRQLTLLSEHLPFPAQGQTYARWQCFAEIAGIDLSLAKLFESHCDALSILHELGDSTNMRYSEIWAVWAAEGGPAPLKEENNYCTGTKLWCSGAAFVQQALMSYKNQQGQSQLCMIQLDQPSISIDFSQWQAVGMQHTQTAKVHFHNSLIRLIGQPDQYLQRPGFWHGAAGIAACWYGAAVRLMHFLQQSCQDSPNSFKSMYMGELAQQLAVTKAFFQYTANLIDTQPYENHERVIRILRAQTEQCCQAVMEEGGEVYACRFALQALYGQTEKALMPGIRPINPLDVMDLKLLMRRDNALIIDTWTV
ncbi:acyl-CoA dehydrogenase [Acinetobacter haemolyticus]|uniref:acyl-CoA dehydrogenase n=1 Tax=Acinetobacter haemolyticus TaxID=29430 RepID=UPI000F73B023|nr:acyl-CoA dehydrogenase [Acinetobacter haemolyticus]RSN73790.1 acyl-CoA dehydrogenase [Acinetobacter haemolyticus]